MSSPLTIFVYEFLTGGACADVPLVSSLMTEGRAMADAVIADFAALDDVRVVTLRDRRLPGVDHPQVTTRFIDAAAGELSQFESSCASADRVLVIAPETDGILSQRVALAREAHPDGVLNCGGEALRLGGDKWELFQRLRAWDVPTIPTELWPGEVSGCELPVVVKPRDGAGCEGVRVMRDQPEATVHSVPDRPETADRLILQPLLDGIPLSSAACFSATGERLLTLPVGKQLIEIDSAIRYSGGEIPWQDGRRDEADRQAEAIWQTLEQNLSGLAGYIGIDWLWDEQAETLRLVEVNPRLTTAYVGYRELFGSRMVESMLESPLIANSSCLQVVRFTADGTVETPASEETVS